MPPSYLRIIWMSSDRICERSKNQYFLKKTWRVAESGCRGGCRVARLEVAESGCRGGCRVASPPLSGRRRARSIGERRRQDSMSDATSTSKASMVDACALAIHLRSSQASLNRGSERGKRSAKKRETGKAGNRQTGKRTHLGRVVCSPLILRWTAQVLAVMFG